MNVMQKKAIYDEMCGILTDYEEVEPEYEADIVARMYEMFVKIQNNWDELVSPADGYEQKPELSWKDVDYLQFLYEDYDRWLTEKYREWQFDEDQTGLPNPYDESREDICKEVLHRFNRSRGKKG